MASDKSLRCALCPNRFNVEDVTKYNYFPETSTCFDCYNKMKKQDFSFTCFGKKNEVSESGKVIGFGYDPLASVDCSMHCPHRKVCRLFAKKIVFKKRKKIKLMERIPFKSKTVIGTAFRMCLKGSTQKRVTNYIEAQGNNASRVLKILQEQKKDGYRWLYTQVKNTVKIYLKG